MSGPRLEELVEHQELVQEHEEAADQREEVLRMREEGVKKREAVTTMRENDIKRWEAVLQEKDKAMTKREGELKKKEEELSKREQALEKQAIRFRASAAWSSTHIHRLPDEVLAKIFALLSLKTMVKVLPVCQRWRGVIEDWCLNKALAFKDPTMSRQEALCLIHSAPKLKSLELYDRTDIVALLDAVSNRCTNLLHLSVQFWKASVPLTEALRRVFRTNPHITELCLIYISASKDLRFYQELGSLLPDLRKLEFWIDQLSDLQLDALIESCSHNQMEEFKALFSPCSNAHIAKLVQFWGRSLRVLELWASNLTDRALARLADCSQLRQLRLARLSTPGEGLCALAALPHLEELKVFHSSEVTSENWCRFFSRSRSSRGLRKLSLQRCGGVDDRVLSSVAAFCPQLEKLELANINETISGVQEVLERCSKLHNLVIFNTVVSFRVMRQLTRGLAPQLRRIRISDRAKRHLGEATLRRVQAQMPHLRIE